MSDKDAELDTKVLDNLIKAFSKDGGGKIGVLGSHDHRKTSDGDNSNATIGLKHEFGDPSEGLPVRSFLRMPLTDNLQQALDKSGAFDKEVLKEIVEEKTMVPWMKKVMLVAEEVVLDAFATGGGGKWPASNMEYKKNHQTLVETGQLRSSITSEVDE